MGIYSEMNNQDIGLDIDLLVEAFLIDDLTHNYPDETVQEFCAPGGMLDALEEAETIKRINGYSLKNIMAMTKSSDKVRRTKVAAIMMARTNGDSLYNKLLQVQAKRKSILSQIYKKYGTKADKAAKVGQKAYIKKMRSVNGPQEVEGRPSFKAMGPDR